MKKILLTIVQIIAVCSFASAQWSTNGTSVYYNGGPVGIGTSTPGHTFTVLGELGMYGSGLNGSTYQRTTIYSNTTDGLLFEAPQDASGNKLNVSFNWRGSGPTPFFIQGSNGNVGVNSTTPYQKLTVNGVLGIYGPGLDGGIYQHTSVYSDVTHGLLIEAPKNSSGTNLDIKFGWRGSVTIPFFISGSTGNIGIGSSAPDEKLTVKGKIHAEEVRVDTSVPGPDYVFEKDYDLLSLPGLEAYISQHKHLPEVPSAAEIAAQGIAVGEMNLLLLKKVEELTLHLIDANKKIEGLAEEVKALKK